MYWSRTRLNEALAVNLLLLGAATKSRAVDCNENGIEDATDLAAATSPDCNANRVPDECEIALGASRDCNRDGVPDECQRATHDLNGNGTPDSCERRAFVPGQILVVFKPHAPEAYIDQLIARNGCAKGSKISFVNEDVDGDGLLGAQEDTRANGKLDKLEFHVLRIVDGDSEQHALGKFSLDPLVELAMPNVEGEMRGHLKTPNDPLFPTQWSLNNRGLDVPDVGRGVIDADIDAPQGWEHSTGSMSVIVAVIDSGIDLGHPDLFGEDANGNGRLDPGEDVGLDGVPATLDTGEGDGALDSNVWSNPGEVGGVAGVDDDGNGVIDDFIGASFATPAPGFVTSTGNVQDLDNHGTHVSGIIGAIGNNNRGVAGINWRVQLLPVRTGDGALSTHLAAINYVLALRAAGHNVRVINYSQGYSPESSIGNMFEVYNRLAQVRDGFSLVLANFDALPPPGILFVSAAGYDGLDLDRTAPEDRNGNGVLNVGEDINGNGILDPRGADNLGNGQLDPTENDGPGGLPPLDDGDGLLEPGEDAPDGVPDVFLDLPIVLANPSLLTVTMSDHRDNFVTYTQRKPNWGTTSVDVAAPGVQIYSTVPQAQGSYKRESGTSQAAPHVSGIAAHMLSMPAFAGHTTAQVKDRILSGVNGPLGVAHPHGVDLRQGLFDRVASGSSLDGRARMVMGDDFGNAPNPPFATKLADWGARHEDIGEEWLGGASGPSDVSPEFDAFDDAAWPPDPDGGSNFTDASDHNDGIVLTGPFTFSPAGGPATVATVEVYIETENNSIVDRDGKRYGGGHHVDCGVHGQTDNKYIWVNGFFDWNRDGDWHDPAEHVFCLRADPSTWGLVSSGHYTVEFNMPEAPASFGGKPGPWARFRLDYGENLGQWLDAPETLVGPSMGGRIHFWNSPAAASGSPPFGLLPAKGMNVYNRYESVTEVGNPDLDLKMGLAQFGEVEDYLLDCSGTPAEGRCCLTDGSCRDVSHACCTMLVDRSG